MVLNSVIEVIFILPLLSEICREAVTVVAYDAHQFLPESVLAHVPRQCVDPTVQ